jgi:hypothetical protein
MRSFLDATSVVQEKLSLMLSTPTSRRLVGKSKHAQR